MITYEYECEGCKRTFDVEQSIKDPCLERCPHCASVNVKRLVSSGNFVLKGDGWYRDGYSSSKKKS
jgi:putative FmdB family regulatory protein